MKTIEQINKQIEELQRKREILLDNDYIEIEHNKKTFRIYKWEDKKIIDFKYPTGFKMAEFQEFIDLIDSKKYNGEINKFYFVKHFSKLQWDKEYCLSRVFFCRSGSVFSIDGDLQISYDNGRVVVVK